MLYRAFDDAGDFWRFWVKRYVPRATTEGDRYRFAGAAFWSGDPSRWIVELILAGYRGPVREAEVRDRRVGERRRGAPLGPQPPGRRRRGAPLGGHVVRVVVFHTHGPRRWRRTHPRGAVCTALVATPAAVVAVTPPLLDVEVP